MRVELLYTDGDPNAMIARQQLVEVLIEDAFETPIQMVAVSSEADAELLEMRGSPTIRIDGIDVDPDSAGAAGLGPRTYAVAGGGTSPIPTKPIIRAAVERARGWGHGRRAPGD